ncbi:hypothetical protein A3L09_04880 [Thermococcus profundus]|uniref:Condensin complex subunit 1 C-terminal domain-containing protein n=1 Tax=Thermococcus profundus TaxID=49899 RepID=A0A2Z2M853_THEPR|nr:hypothetical protein [Thermococcus profundus]ASJ02640.1 hypothetical protein A3L09_04880 [Thermococcus profundus]
MEGEPGPLKEHLASWRIGKAAELVLSSDDALRALLSILHGKDKELKKAALIALEEALKGMPDVRRLGLVKVLLDTLIDLAKEGDDDLLIRALRTIRALITGIPLDPRSFVKLNHALKDLVKQRGNEVVLLEIPSILENVRVTSSDPRVYDVISRLLHSRNPRLKAMGLRLTLNTSSYTGDSSLLKMIFSEIKDMLTGEDIALTDFALNILLEVSDCPLQEELVDEVAGVLTLVKNLAIGRRSELREKARIVAEKLEDSIYRYYKNQPEEAKEKIQELLINERFYEAIDLALAVGDTYVLKWLEGELERMEKERLKINERILPGPKYPSPPPESKAQKTLNMPDLHKFRGGKLDLEKLTKNAEISKQIPRMPDEETRRELEAVLTSGKTSKLVDLALRKPEVVFELERKLEEGSKLEKMDALWALSKLSEKLKPKAVFILEPVVAKLFEVAHSTKNRWMRLRATRTLATLALKSKRRDEIVGKFLDGYLSREKRRAISALEFFSYYFLETWDEKTARMVLPGLRRFLKDDRLRFDALMVLEAIVTSIPAEKAKLLRDYVPLLERIKKTALPDEQKLAIRILEEMASRFKVLFNRRVI